MEAKTYLILRRPLKKSETKSLESFLRNLPLPPFRINTEDAPDELSLHSTTPLFHHLLGLKSPHQAEPSNTPLGTLIKEGAVKLVAYHSEDEAHPYGTAVFSEGKILYYPTRNGVPLLTQPSDDLLPPPEELFLQCQNTLEKIRRAETTPSSSATWPEAVREALAINADKSQRKPLLLTDQSDQILAYPAKHSQDWTIQVFTPEEDHTLTTAVLMLQEFGYEEPQGTDVTDLLDWIFQDIPREEEARVIRKLILCYGPSALTNPSRLKARISEEERRAVLQ